MKITFETFDKIKKTVEIRAKQDNVKITHFECDEYDRIIFYKEPVNSVSVYAIYNKGTNSIDIRYKL